MPQVIKTKTRGEFRFRKTWVDGGRHIGALAGGGYAYLSGLIVDKRQDLIDLIPEGEERDRALAWWDNKDQQLEERQFKKVILDTDGDFKWEDGTPIETAQSIIENVPRGDQADVLLAWFHKKQAKEKGKAESARDIQDRITRESIEEQKQKVVEKRAIGRPRKMATG